MRRPPRSTLFPYTTLRRVVPAQRGEVEPLRATRAPPRRCHLYAIEPCLAHQWIAGFRLTDFRALEQSWKRAPQALQTRPGTLILVRAESLQIAVADSFAIAVQQAAVGLDLGRRVGEVNVPIARNVHLVDVSADLPDQRQ